MTLGCKRIQRYTPAPQPQLVQQDMGLAIPFVHSQIEVVFDENKNIYSETRI